MNLEQQRKRAKDLRRAHREGNIEAAVRVARHLPRAKNLSPSQVLSSALQLSEAQFVIAREAGFSSWPELQRVLDRNRDRSVDEESIIADALAGRDDEVTRALERDPDVPRRSIYVAAVVADWRAMEAFVQSDRQIVDRRGGKRGWTPLLYSCCSRYRRDDANVTAVRLAIARQLLDAGADPNAVGAEPGYANQEWRPVCGAVYAIGSVELVRLLIFAGAAIGKTSHVLVRAVRGGNEEVLRVLLEGAPADWYQVGWALLECVILDRPDLARMLIVQAAKSSVGSSQVARKALLAAVKRRRSLELIEILLAGDSSELSQPVRRDVYRTAVRYGHTSAMKLLEELGTDPGAAMPVDGLDLDPDVADQDDDLQLVAATPADIELFERAADAVAFGDLDALRGMLDQAPQLVRMRSPRPHHCTLLNYCAANGTEAPRQRTPPNAPAIAELLLERGADPNATCQMYGGAQTTMGLMLTSAHPAGAGLDGELTRVLLKYGAKMEDHALVGVIEYGLTRSVQAFLEAGAPVDNLFVAAGLGRIDLAEKLLANGADINERYTHAGYSTPLHAAATMGETAMAVFLLERGADKSLHNRWDATPANAASFFDHPALAKVIDDYASPE